jgi:hypothetical protein
MHTILGIIKTTLQLTPFLVPQLFESRCSLITFETQVASIVHACPWVVPLGMSPFDFRRPIKL